ncbi:MAG: 3-dehydroquinate synthase II [Candidatus Ranarchaeia archaeon]
MSNRIILKVTRFNRKDITNALEHGFTQFAIESRALYDKIRSLGAVTIFALRPDIPGDHKVQADISIQKISSKTDELEALNLVTPFIIIETSDWHIIPLENLISKFQKRPSKLIAYAKTLEEAELLLTTLEHGVDLVMLALTSKLDLKHLSDLVTGQRTIELTPLEVTDVIQVGLGDRVCIDTCSVLEPLEGMLVGSQSNGYFLVHNENVESPYADPRPFRVNAGAIHSYVMVPEGKTKYLSEVVGGTKVLIVSAKGSTRIVTVGRAKVERRPLLMIIARRFTEHKGNVPHKNKDNRDYQVILQNAETIRLVGIDNQLKSVAHLKRGDIVLGLIEEGGRHFGEKIEETIQEL